MTLDLRTGNLDCVGWWEDKDSPLADPSMASLHVHLQASQSIGLGQLL